MGLTQEKPADNCGTIRQVYFKEDGKPITK